MIAPETFDALVLGSMVLGLLLAGRRFWQDIRRDVPADAPDWAQEHDGAIDTGSAADGPG